MSLAAVMQRLDQLRDVDRLIDISKSTLQFNIVIALSNKGELSAAEIAKEVGQRRKAVTDAMRKLKNKGLVELVSDEGKNSAFKLSSTGENCVTTLMDFMDVKKADAAPNLPTASPSTPFSKDMGLENLPVASVTSELLLMLGTSKENRLPVKRLARSIGLSTQRTESYLDVYLNREPKLFRRYMDEPRSVKLLKKIGIQSKTKRQEPVYALTNEGLQQFYRLPAYRKLKDSITYKVLSRLTRTGNPREMFKRLAIVLCSGGLISALGVMLPLGPFSFCVWIFFTTLVGSITLADFMLYKAVG
ncbi:MAG: helix-turn-helix domain-containing protein [Candidatus Methanomethylicus sp.]|nr:helix-turn-helix domain-containing protein [Candidatus Methanomethylicus sp.]